MVILLAIPVAEDNVKTCFGNLLKISQGIPIILIGQSTDIRLIMYFFFFKRCSVPVIAFWSYLPFN